MAAICALRADARKPASLSQALYVINADELKSGLIDIVILASLIKR